MSAKENKIKQINIFKGKVIDVTLDTVSIENGDSEIISEREVVHHRGGVCALIKKKNGMIPFVKQFRYAVNSELIELPAGKLNKNEEIDEAIIREVEEEVGLYPLKVTYLGKLFVSPGFSTEVIYLYFIDDYQESKQHLDSDEFLDVIELSYDEAINMVETGKILDAKTVALLYKCEKYFKMEN